MQNQIEQTERGYRNSGTLLFNQPRRNEATKTFSNWRYLLDKVQMYFAENPEEEI